MRRRPKPVRKPKQIIATMPAIGPEGPRQATAGPDRIDPPQIRAAAERSVFHEQLPAGHSRDDVRRLLQFLRRQQPRQARSTRQAAASVPQCTLNGRPRVSPRLRYRPTGDDRPFRVCQEIAMRPGENPHFAQRGRLRIACSPPSEQQLSQGGAARKAAAADPQRRVDRTPVFPRARDRPRLVRGPLSLLRKPGVGPGENLFLCSGAEDAGYSAPAPLRQQLRQGGTARKAAATGAQGSVNGSPMFPGRQGWVRNPWLANFQFRRSRRRQGENLLFAQWRQTHVVPHLSLFGQRLGQGRAASKAANTVRQGHVDGDARFLRCRGSVPTVGWASSPGRRTGVGPGENLPFTQGPTVVDIRRPRIARPAIGPARNRPEGRDRPCAGVADRARFPRCRRAAQSPRSAISPGRRTRRPAPGENPGLGQRRPATCPQECRGVSGESAEVGSARQAAIAIPQTSVDCVPGSPVSGIVPDPRPATFHAVSGRRRPMPEPLRPRWTGAGRPGPNRARGRNWRTEVVIRGVATQQRLSLPTLDVSRLDPIPVFRSIEPQFLAKPNQVIPPIGRRVPKSSRNRREKPGFPIVFGKTILDGCHR